MSTGSTTLNIIGLLITTVFVGGPIAGIIALRRDKREAPRDKVDTLQKAVSLAGEAAANSIEAGTQAAAAHARASSAEADAAEARAVASRVRSDLDTANLHSAKQDADIEGLRTELDAVKARLQSWISWGRRVHDEWSSLREHMTPPPLPDDLTD